jgi:hypothetical protein
MTVPPGSTPATYASLFVNGWKRMRVSPLALTFMEKQNGEAG